MLARIFAALLAAAPNAVVAPVPLQPTSKWNVDYDEAQCVAARDYGTKEQPLFLILKPSPNGNVMRVLVAKKGGFSGFADQLGASIQFDDGRPVRINALRSSSKDKTLTIYSFDMPMDVFKAGQLAKAITVSARGLTRTFSVNAIPALLTELEKCRLNLLQHYNADGSGIREPATSITPLSRIFSGKDYPSTAMSRSDQGTVTITVLLDEAGKVQDCSVDGSAGAATLDTMSCYLIQERAKFKPAIGMDGKPVRSAFFQRITWRIEQ
jgi:TonB family protein